MKIWVDAQISPTIATWISEQFEIEAVAIRDVGLRDSSDQAIFDAAKRADAIVLTKDSDFLRLLESCGSPPKVIWITCGNTSNASLREVLSSSLKQALNILASGDDLVEIRDKSR